MSIETLCVVCGGPFSNKRMIIQGRPYHERCSCMSYPTHTYDDYARLNDKLARALHALQAVVTAYGSQDSFTKGLDNACSLAKDVLDDS